MAAQSEVIREFLVSLGFKVDEKGLRDFSSGIGEGTAAVTSLVTAVTGAALAVAAGVTSFALNIEQLYFASKRVGSSVSDIKAFDAAARNLGVSADESRGNIEALATALRNNPSTEGLIKSLGIDTRQANGEMKDTTDLLAEIGQKLQAMPSYQRKLVGSGWFGLSDKMIIALSDPQFAIELAKQQRILQDVDYEKASKGAHDFGVRLRELQTRIQTVGDVFRSDILEMFGPEMEKSVAWFETNQGKMVKAIKIIELAMKDFYNGVLDPILDKLGKITDLLYKLGVLVAENIPGYQPGNSDLSMKPSHGGVSSSGSGSAQRAMEILTGLGLQKHHAAGIAGNLSRESGFNPAAENGSHYGIAQWDKSRQADFERWSGHSIKGSSFEEQLQFLNWEMTQGAEKKAGALLKATVNEQEAAASFYRNYERAGALDSSLPNRVNDAVQIMQNTTINVTGGDAEATGRAVAREQKGVNADVVRNMQTAVR